jgi:hypothetical protein
MMGDTSEAGTAYPLGLSLFLLLAIVLPVDLRILITSGIFKLFFH